MTKLRACRRAAGLNPGNYYLRTRALKGPEATVWANKRSLAFHFLTVLAARRGSEVETELEVSAFSAGAANYNLELHGQLQHYRVFA